MHVKLDKKLLTLRHYNQNSSFRSSHKVVLEKRKSNYLSAEDHEHPESFMQNETVRKRGRERFN